MKVLINNSDDTVSVEPGTTLGVVLGQLREFLQGRNLAVVELELDGQPLTPEKETEWLNRPTSDFSILRVEARDIPGMCMQLLGTIERSVNWLIDQVTSVSERIGGDQPEGLQKDLQGIFQTFADVKDGLGVVCRHAGINLSELEVDGDKFGSRVEDIAVLLQDIHDQMLNEDLHALAETLEFDLAERLTEWRRAAEVLRETIAQRKSKS